MDEDAPGQGEDIAVAHVFDDDHDGSVVDDEELEAEADASSLAAKGGDAEDESDGQESGDEDGDDDGSSTEDVEGYAGLCSRGTAEAAGDAARSWLARIQVDGPGAMATALCIAVDAARPGVKPRDALITPGMLLANDPASAVAEVCDAMAEDAADKTRFFTKKGHVPYSAFWRALVEESERATLHDTDCFDMLVRWFEEMTVASSRPLRLTACAAVYAIVDGLISVGLILRAKLETAKLQLETETKKKSDKKCDSARGKKLKDDVFLFETDLAEIDELKQKVFASVLTLKYRDVSPEVRAASVVALVDWALRDTAIFLADSHNKYAGWVLFDKTPFVRRTALEAVTRLFGGTKSVSSLEIFLSRFRDRIVAMSGDSDNDVCVAAVNLCTVLVPLEVFVGKLNDSIKIKEAKEDNVEAICALTSSDNRELRKAAGAFAAAIVKLSGDTDENVSPVQSVLLENAVTKKGRRRRKDDMVKLLAEKAKKKKKSKVAETAATGISMDVEKAKGDLREIVFTVLGDDAGDVAASGLVLEVVWEHLPAVHCWSAYCDLLLEYNGSSRNRKSGDVETLDDSDTDQLSRNDMVSVAGLLLAAARQVCLGPRKKGRSKGISLETSSDERMHLTDCFVANLPKLMTLYRTDPLVLQLLAELPRSFDLSSCLKSGRSGDFKKMLAKLGDVLTRSTGSPEVVTAAAHTLKHLSTSEDSLANEASVALRKEVASAARALHAVVRTGVDKAGQAAISAAVMRANVLSELLDVPKSAADDAVVLLRACWEKTRASIDTTACVDVCRLAANSLMWESAGLVASAIPADGSDIDEDAVESAVRSFAVRRDEVLVLLARLLREESTACIEICQAAFNSICLVTSISVGVHTRMSASLMLSQTESSCGTVLSRQVIDLMSVDLEEEELCGGLSSCFLDVITLRIQGQGVSESAAGVSAVADKGARDLLAGLCQVAFVGALPADAVHLPLLGLLLKKKRGEGVQVSSVSGFDMAKIYYARLKATVPAARVALLEQRLLYEAARVGAIAANDDVHESLRAVRTLATIIAREYAMGSSDSKECDKLLTELVTSAFKLPEAIPAAWGAGDNHHNYRKVCRNVAFAAGAVLAPRVSKATASSLLERLNDDHDASESEDFELSDFRRYLEAAVKGKAAPVARRLKIPSSRIETQRRRRAPRQKKSPRQKKTQNKSSENRKQADPVDLTTVRRSGRTQRVVYVEADSEESESEDDSGDDNVMSELEPEESIDGQIVQNELCFNNGKARGDDGPSSRDTKDPEEHSKEVEEGSPPAIIPQTPTKRKRKSPSVTPSPQVRRSPRRARVKALSVSGVEGSKEASAAALDQQTPTRNKRKESSASLKVRKSGSDTQGSEELPASALEQRRPTKRKRNDLNASPRVRKSPRVASQKNITISRLTNSQEQSSASSLAETPTRRKDKASSASPGASASALDQQTPTRNKRKDSNASLQVRKPGSDTQGSEELPAPALEQRRTTKRKRKDLNASPSVRKSPRAASQKNVTSSRLKNSREQSLASSVAKTPTRRKEKASSASPGARKSPRLLSRDLDKRSPVPTGAPIVKRSRKGRRW